MKIVEASGSFREVGRKVGEATRADVAFVRDRFVPPMLEEVFGGDELLMRRDAFLHLDATAAIWPDIADYARGLAEGAGLPLGDALPVVFMEEMSLPLDRERCSTLLAMSEDGWIVGHQEDNREMFYGRLSMLDLRLDGFPRLLSLTYPGTFPGMGASLNEAGLAVTANSLSIDPVPGTGKQAKHFMAVLDPTFMMAMSLIANGPHQLADHFLVVNGEGMAVSIEVSSHAEAKNDCEIVQIVDRGPVDEGQVLEPFVHANSVRWLEPWASGIVPDPAQAGSRMRHRALERRAQDPPRDPEAMMRFLQEREGVIRRDASCNFTGQADSVTVASVVVRPATRELWCATYGEGDDAPRRFAL